MPVPRFTTGWSPGHLGVNLLLFDSDTNASPHQLLAQHPTEEGWGRVSVLSCEHAFCETLLNRGRSNLPFHLKVDVGGVADLLDGHSCHNGYSRNLVARQLAELQTESHYRMSRLLSRLVLRCWYICVLCLCVGAEASFNPSSL
jgi:hypothetical protein